jgi:hypothetical protein
MSVTQINGPQLLMPAYNQMYFTFDSTQKTQSGFRYLVNVMNEDTAEDIGIFRIKPEPVTLYGKVDVSRLLQTELFADFQNLSSFVSFGHKMRYRLRVDEEYFVVQAFIDYDFAGAGSWPNAAVASVNPNGFARTMIKCTTAPIYVAGDVITIAQDPGAGYRPELEGVHTVLDVFFASGFHYIVLDLLWIRKPQASTGVSSYADGRKTTIEGLTTSAFDTFKGAEPFKDFPNWSHDQYLLDDANAKFLTTLPTEVRISKDVPSWLGGYINKFETQYLVFDIGGTLYRYQMASANLADYVLFNILPSDAIIEEVFSGSWIPFGGGLDLTDVKTYTVQLVGTGNFSKETTITLYDECDFHDKYNVTFLDRLGSWITIPFNKGAYMNQEVTKSTIDRKLPEGYNSTDRGREIFNSEEVITYTVNTGILSQMESQYIRELISSPQAFVNINGEGFQSIFITSSTAPLHLRRTQRDRKIQLQFIMATQDEING